MITNIIKRDGLTVNYDREKIVVAITKAYLEVHPGGDGDAMRIIIGDVATKVELALSRPGRSTHVPVEDVQDQVELELMRSQIPDVAKAYIVYRATHAAKRQEQEAAHAAVSVKPHKKINVGGLQVPFNVDFVAQELAKEMVGLDGVDMQAIVERVEREIYDGTPEQEVDAAIILATRTFIEREPVYNKATARLQLRQMYRETFGEEVSIELRHRAVQKAFPAMIKSLVDYGLGNPALLTFDLPRLGLALNASRDQQFDYIGVKTLYDRYFVHDLKRDKRLELPQTFFMRVAMGLALNEDDREARAIEFYNVLSSFDFMNSTPTLFNSGLKNAQLASCFLTTIPDDLEAIGRSYLENMLLQKYSGGLGNDWTNVRALGSIIKGTNGESQGVVPFMKVTNDVAVAVNQGGKRKGAVCGYLETWHLDIDEFLELRKNTGDDRRRTHDMNTANWVPDLFMTRVMQDATWTLFSPNEVPELHHLVGQAFETKYTEYEAKASRGELRQHRTIKAKDLWRKMLTMLFETGHPWITFKDACNVRSPQQHVGVVHSSNLCVAPETLLLTDKGHFPIAALTGQTINVWNGEEFSPTQVVKTGVNQELWSVFTSDGRSLDCTPYHKFYVQEGYGTPPREVRAHELEEGMKLIKFDAPVIEGTLDFDRPYTNGFFTGDGTQLPNGQARIYLYDDKVKLDTVFMEEIDSMINWRATGTRAEAEFWGLSEKFSIPSIQHTIKSRLKWLAGYLDADGTIARNGDSESIQASSTNYLFLKRVQFMLQTVGVNAKISQLAAAEQRRMPLNDGSGQSALFNCQETWRLLITSTDTQKLLGLGLDCRRLVIKYREVQRAAAHFATVVVVTNAGRRDDTYCVTEPKRHMAVFNGILTGQCTEITLNTSETETAVCNIGSVNLLSHIDTAGNLMRDKLRTTVRIAMRMLDNVIDLTIYQVDKARASNQRHRPVGLGMMGFQDCLSVKGLSYASAEAVQFADESAEVLYYFAYEASSDLAVERGRYESYAGSLWSQGVLPLDTLRMLEDQRGGEFCDFNYDSALGMAAWDALRGKIQVQGMRNSNCGAIAPTATIGNIVGVEASIEPCFGNVSVKSNMSGDFTMVNEYMVRDFKRLDIWDEAMLADLKFYKGSIQQISRVPDHYKQLYLTAHEVGPIWLIDAAARRQKWIDMAQSLNIYVLSPTGKKLDETYKHAWIKGCKTTYYLRALEATSAESSTGRIGALNAVSADVSTSALTQAMQEVAGARTIESVEMPEPEGAACFLTPDDPGFADCEACQ